MSASLPPDLELRKQVQIGLDQLERGEYSDLDDESLGDFFDGIEAEVQQELAAEKDLREPL